ncbi:MAG: hypothetical protein QGI11_08960 [Nitrospinota bacterium]|jgi:hypothetical protein|nr:hypothetical protein [Nitrospinota bacterium]|tara:strand:- start:1070 stop:1330 length:261 start_codon:yes stop_codon:yes gene_type:complete
MSGLKKCHKNDFSRKGILSMNFHNEEEVFHPYDGGKIHVLDTVSDLDIHLIECENFQEIKEYDFGSSDKRDILALEEKAFPFPENF